MKPNMSDTHVNRPITDIVVAFMQDQTRSISDKVFPVVPVEHVSDVYYEWVRDDFWRSSAAERAPGAEAETGGFTNTTGTYTTKEYAIAKDLPDALMTNADTELRLERAAAEYIGLQLLLKREILWNSTYFAGSIWTGGTGGATDQAGVASGPSTNQFLRWDVANSTPIEDIREQMLSIEEKTGYLPNTLVITPHVWRALVDHASLLDRIKYTQRGAVTQELLASLLGLDNVYVAGLSQNTGKEGQTGAFSFIHGKHALLVYTAKAPSLFAPSGGYTFSLTSRFGSGPDGQRVRRYYNDLKSSWRIEGEMAFVQKLISAELGCFFSAAVS